ncbi:MAG: EF-P lysine aminoacylase EpmA [Candidatus Uhrbacteria bacterium]
MRLDVLKRRHEIIRGVREFFWARGFLEVETPVLLAHPSQEPELEPLRTTVHDVRGKAHEGFLRMSPEFSLKKLLGSLQGATTSPDETVVSGVFEIGPVFRDVEPWGGHHNPEFTMLEWYRLGATYIDLMDDCEALVRFLCHSKQSAMRNLTRNNDKTGVASQSSHYLKMIEGGWRRLSMKDAWQQYANLDLDMLLTRDTMAEVCEKRGLSVLDSDSFDDLFFKIFLTDIEPKLGKEQPTFVYDWPSQMAALARKKPDDLRYAERVELYILGLELANGFSELTDAAEQRVRFLEDQELRKRLGRQIYPIDEAFLAALDSMPECAGMALGIDRLVMLLVDEEHIDAVRWLPAGSLWNT